MRNATETRVNIGPIRRRWRALGLRKRIGLILLLSMFAGWGTFRAVDWWTEWPARSVLRSRGELYPTAFSPDGAILVTRVYPTGELILWDVAGGEKRATWEPSEKHSQFGGAFSPDGRTYASPWFRPRSGQNFSVNLIDVATGKVRSTVASPLGGFLGLRFRDGGSTLRLLAVGPNVRTLLDVDTASGQIIVSRPVSTPSTSSFYGFNALSDDGRFLAVSGPTAAGAAKASTSISIWDLDQDSEAFQLARAPGDPVPVRIALSPDGETLAVTLDDGSIELWDLAKRNLRLTAGAHGPSYRSVSLGFSPDGSTVASTGTLVVRSTLSFEFARAIVAHFLSGPDRAEEMELVLLDTSTGRRIRSSRRNGMAVFSPDSRTLAASHDDGTIKLYDLPKAP